MILKRGGEEAAEMVADRWITLPAEAHSRGVQVLILPAHAVSKPVPETIQWLLLDQPACVTPRAISVQTWRSRVGLGV